MNKLKITPLIVIAVLCLLIAIWIPFVPEPEPRYRSGVNVPWIMPLLMLFGSLVAFAADRFIKKHSTALKNVWLIEGVIVGFVILYSIFFK